MNKILSLPQASNGAVGAGQARPQGGVFEQAEVGGEKGGLEEEEGGGGDQEGGGDHRAAGGADHPGMKETLNGLCVIW